MPVNQNAKETGMTCESAVALQRLEVLIGTWKTVGQTPPHASTPDRAPGGPAYAGLV